MRRRHHLHVYPFIVLLFILLLLCLSSVEAEVYAAGPRQQSSSFHVSRNILSFTGIEGGPNLRAQQFGVTNTGSGPINWSVSVDGSAAWLDVVPTSGLDDGVVRVSVDTTGLISGAFTETLTVSAQETTAIEVIRVTLVVTSEVAPLYAEGFQAYAPGTSPVDWLDTGAESSLEEDGSLFGVMDLGEQVFGTLSTLDSIHSHYLGAGSGAFSSYEFTGRMKMTASDGGIGVTFLSQYPQANAYYRLRSYGSGSFHLSPHGTTITGGTTDTGVVPVPDDWYLFRVWVEDARARTEIRAKVWAEGDPEPGDWQVDCYDASSTRLAVGTVGVWGNESGGKYWDDLVVNLLPPEPDESPPFAHGHDPALGAVNEVYTFTVKTMPVIDVWYGSHQVFGHLGNPQRWVNILGNVSDPDGIDSLTYSLNGGLELPLSVGPDGLRLEDEGDFNVEISRTVLSSGLNQVVITATDNFNNQTVETVTVEYVDGNVWPEPYSIDWSTVTAITDVVQIVDGLWTWEGDSIRPVIQGYDRIVAIGDMTWDDYEVRIPIIFHGIDPDYTFWWGRAGAGIVMRWHGHVAWGDAQPTYGWFPLGAMVSYQWLPGGGNSLGLFGNEGTLLAEDTSRTLELGVPYNFKMRVETVPDQGGLYSVKVWEASQPEPSEWDLIGQEGLVDPQDGSLLLLTHYVDVSFGDVTVIPLPFYTLTVNSVGNGEVIVDPDRDVYSWDEVVTLTATADPGWSFTGWSGDLSSSTNPITVTMTGNRVITATFTQDEYTLTVSTVGSGSVDRDPDQAPYHYDDVVTLTATANTGWTFDSWSGDLSGTTNPITVTMTGSRVITATFTEDKLQIFLPVITVQGSP
jgi:uncharacterized repeat protein (TIGR02543 family)